MTNRESIVTGSAVAAAALCVCLVGCAEEEPEAVVQPVKVVREPAPPPPPPVTSIADLIAEMGIDERIELPEASAPDNDEDRRAVLEFFDAFARGDADTLRPMLTLADQMELEQLIDSGAWSATVDEISRISLVTGESPYGQECALAVFEVGYGFQPQLWYYASDDEGHQFEAALTPPNMIDRLSGSDWIKAWHDILEQELAKANEPDEDFSLAQKNLDVDEETTGSTKAPPGALGRPSGPITPTTPSPGGPLSPTGK